MYSESKEVAFTSLYAVSKSVEVGLNLVVVTLFVELLKTSNLFVAHFSVVNFKNIDWSFFFKYVFVNADNGLTTRVDTSLSTSSCFFNTHFWHTSFNSLSHTTELFDFFDVCPCLVHEFIGEFFYIVRTSPWVDGLGDECFLLDKDLGVTSNTSREVGWKCDSLIKCVGVE